MDNQKILDCIRKLNEDEIFYKGYFLASKSTAERNKFLSKLDPDDIRDRRLIVPELAPDLIPYAMGDQEYFAEDDHISVRITRHNRFTPAFLHKHSFFEIVYVMAGHCTQNIGLQSVHFSAGDICLIAPGVFHTMEVFDDESLVFNILLRRSTFHQMFTPLTLGDDLLSEFFLEGLYSTNQIQYLIFHTNNVSFVYDAMLEMCGEQVERDGYTDQILVGMLTKLTAQVMRYFKDKMESNYLRQSVLPHDFLIMNYIQEHLKDVTLAEVAEHFGFSVSYCSRLIKASTGQGFNEWKLTLKLRMAEHLLINTNQTVREISDSLGYTNPESFIRLFKKQLHISPTQYRKQTKAGHKR